MLPERITTLNSKEDHYWLLNKSTYNIARPGPDEKKKTHRKNNKQMNRTNKLL
jgi:hypothetical protein